MHRKTTFAEDSAPTCRTHAPADAAAETPPRLRCACGLWHASDDEALEGHGPLTATSAAQQPPQGLEGVLQRAVETSVLKALFPHAGQRRQFLKAVGRRTAMAAIASVVPLGTLTALAQERGPLEKKQIKVGYVPITCATPLIMAQPMGQYGSQGLAVELVKTPGWGAVRERMTQGAYDASHFLSPMPLAMSLGLDSPATPMHVATIQNINGQAITLALKHRDNRDPAKWKGLRFGVPFEHSMHNFLLRYYLAEAGLDPDRDVQIKVVPPPQMVAELKAERIDGFLGPDPFNQRAVYDEVGFIHLFTKQIWDGHPCCAFGTSAAFIQQNPNTFAALYRAIINASLIASMPSEREAIAKALAPAAYLNQPEELLAQVLVGRFPDGLGNQRSMPDRASFDPVPWQSMAVWMLTQMKRWGYLKGEVNYRQIAEKVFLLTDAKRQMVAAGWRPPEGAYRRHRIMGREFDANDPEGYLKGFAIRRSA